MKYSKKAEMASALIGSLRLIFAIAIAVIALIACFTGGISVIRLTAITAVMSLAFDIGVVHFGTVLYENGEVTFDYNMES